MYFKFILFLINQMRTIKKEWIRSFYSDGCLLARLLIKIKIKIN